MKNLFLTFISCLVIFSCAKVGSPSGGEKDITAPKFLKANIDSPRVKIPVDFKKLILHFDEYINLKDIANQLVISPPIQNIKKITPSNLPSKYISIEWTDSLQKNTTYNFNFGNSIQDNNEGNVLSYFNFAFSTGAQIDSLKISGKINHPNQEIKTNENEKESKTIVGLYHPDDDVLKQKPYYISKIEKDGTFEINHIKAGIYKILAFDDQNSNSIYDLNKENIGFINDNITLDKNISNLNINVFPYRKKIEYKSMSTQPGGILMLFEGNPKNIEVREVSGIIKNYKISHPMYSDSVKIWFNPKAEKLEKNQPQNIKFSCKTDKKSDTVQIFYQPDKDEINFHLKKNNIVPQTDLEILSNEDIEKIDVEKWKLTSESDSIHLIPFVAEISKITPNKIILSSNHFNKEKKFHLSIPKGTIHSFSEENSENLSFDFKIESIENYGTLTLKLKNEPKHPFWIELTNGQGKTIIKRKEENKTELKFVGLTPDIYLAKILVDNNENGIWDTSDFESKTQAENVYSLNKIIEVRPLWEIVEEWDLENNNKNDEKTN